MWYTNHTDLRFCVPYLMWYANPTDLTFCVPHKIRYTNRTDLRFCVPHKIRYANPTDLMFCEPFVPDERRVSANEHNPSQCVLARRAIADREQCHLEEKEKHQTPATPAKKAPGHPVQKKPKPFRSPGKISSWNPAPSGRFLRNRSRQGKKPPSPSCSHGTS